MAAPRTAAAIGAPPPAPPRPPQLDQRLFRHELTPVWLQTAAVLAGEVADVTDTLDRVAWFGCQAWATPAVVAAVHPSAPVRVWDPDPARLASLATVGRHAGLANLEIDERRSPSVSSLGGRFDLVVVDGLVDSATDIERERLITAAASLLRPGGFLVVGYRTVVGWGEVAPSFACCGAPSPRAPPMVHGRCSPRSKRCGAAVPPTRRSVPRWRPG